MRRTVTMWIALAATGMLALGSCGGSGGEADEESTVAEQGDGEEIGEPDVETNDRTGETPEESGPGYALQPMNDSGVTGDVVVTRQDGSTRIVVSLDGATGADSYMAHVHDGVCGRDGGVALVLADFRERPGGLTSETVAERRDFEPLGNHFVQVHHADGTPVACTNLDVEPAGGANTASSTSDSRSDTDGRDPDRTG